MPTQSDEFIESSRRLRIRAARASATLKQMCHRLPMRMPDQGNFDQSNLVEKEVARLTAESERQQRLYETILSTTPDLVYVFDLNHRFTYANQALLTMWGRTWDDAIGKNCLELGYEPWHAEMHDWEIEQVIATKQPIRGRVPFTGTHGRRIYDYIFVPVFGADGKVEAIAGTTRDVTEAFQVEARLKGMFNQSMAGIALCEPSGRFTLVNERYCQIVGRSADELYSLRMQDITHPDDLSRNLPLFEKAANDGVTFDIEKRYVRPDGTHVWASDSVSLLRDSDGQSVGVQCVSLDITSRRMAEDALVRAKEQAEAANTAKDNFLATLSHELRTPLTPVLATLTDWCMRQRVLAELMPDVEMMRRNIELESRLIDDLLDMTRIVRNKVALNLELVDAHQLIGAVATIYRSEIQGKKLRLSLNLDADERLVHADPARLQQVFWNVLRNATKFTPEGGSIDVSTSDEGDRLKIEISDSGIGMEPEMIKRLFRPFEQGDAQSVRQYGGLGLGLAISKSFVELHGGSIGAASGGSGKGSTFTIALPVADRAATAAETFPVTAIGADGDGQHGVERSLQVLLVEDHADTARVLSRLLRSSGHQVAVADSVASALTTLHTVEPDVIVSDVGLPDGTGIDLMREIRRQHGQRYPAIALTGFGMEDDVTKCREAGFNQHLTKPVNFQKLELAIRQIASGSERAQRS